MRARVADILTRKRSFVHLDEYLTRHPGFIEAVKARPCKLSFYIIRHGPCQVAHTVKDGLHPTDVFPKLGLPAPIVLVRWLGKEFDAQKILEIKQMEFGGKAKLKKMPKSRF